MIIYENARAVKTRAQSSSPQPLILRGQKRAEVDGKFLDRWKWFIYHKLNSIGYDEEMLVAAERMGATIARNRDLDSGITYLSPISRIRAHGIVVDHAGHGRQIHLPLRLWDRINGETIETPLMQADLFAEVR